MFHFVDLVALAGRADARSVAGSKATELARLQARGMQVAQGWVTTARLFEEFVAIMNIEDEFERNYDG